MATAHRTSSHIETEDVIRRAIARDAQAVRQIILTYNQRLYRIIRAVVRCNADAEDVLQEAYLQAFAHLGSFRGESSLATWLSQIALNAAFLHLRRQKRLKRAVQTTELADAEIIPFPNAMPTPDPERSMAQRQMRQLIEDATDSLPENFRLVFVARMIEGLSVEETAAMFDLPVPTVKTRLHRARKLVRKSVEDRVGPILLDAFPFAGARCARLTDAVLTKLGLQ